MSQFNVFFVKELRENWRSFKFIWIPLVFILLGASDPVMNYFLEDILNAVGNVPEGFEMMMPDYAPIDLIYATTGQFQSIGLIVLVAAFAGSISRERQNGTATLLYVRPISYRTFFLSKWAVASIVSIFSAVAGYGASMYYTAILYGTVDPASFMKMLGTYIIWILFVMAVTLAMSAIFNTAIATALSIIIISIGLIIDSLIGSFWTISPWKLATYGVQFISGGQDAKDYLFTLCLTIGLTIVLIGLGMLCSKKNASLTKI
ncbi:ABC transporter permease [Lysinibacillus sp. 54212]|uniref:ABC transporter permease n=1 Tax=Lysinibacillus sp. 54212 TaxID=3119829 RepID=UPI002FC93FBF